MQQRKEKVLPAIPKEYWDLREAFSEKGPDELPPHCPMDCAIEILHRAKLPKPKPYSITLRELDELQLFTDKNLTHGFIQPA